MKYIVRVILFHILALWLASQLVDGLYVRGAWWTFAVSGSLLGLFVLLIQPLLSILFIPLNLLTLGLARFLIAPILLYLVSVIIYDLSIRPFTTPVIHAAGFAIPSFSFNYFLSLFIVSFLIKSIVDVLHNLTDHG